MFAGSGVNVTLNDRPYLGAAIGCHEYIEEYVCEFQSARMVILHQKILSDIAKSQPQAAFSALTHGLLSN